MHQLLIGGKQADLVEQAKAKAMDGIQLACRQWRHKFHVSVLQTAQGQGHNNSIS